MRNFIKHCKLISVNSYSDYYRSFAKAKAWDAIAEYNKTLLNADTVNLAQLLYYTRLNAKALMEILPHPENASYKSQHSIISQLIDYAKK